MALDSRLPRLQTQEEKTNKVFEQMQKDFLANPKKTIAKVMFLPGYAIKLGLNEPLRMTGDLLIAAELVRDANYIGLAYTLAKYFI